MKIASIELPRDTEREDEELLLLLKKARALSGLSLDFWVDFTDGVSIEEVRSLVSKIEILLSATQHH